jgi:hypothetical protein
MIKVDIFSRFIDNYGDLTIPVRLANGLSDKYDVSVNLYISMKDNTRRILSNNQINSNIAIIDIDNMDEYQEPNNKIISIFDTKLPISYINNIPRNAMLINYEYFSAETWVDDFHLQTSPVDKRYEKIFYFPGLTIKSGSPIYCIPKLNKPKITMNLNNFLINIFSYPSEGITRSLKSLDRIDIKTQCNLFDSNLSMSLVNIELNNVDFCSFEVFDQYLNEGNINFIRGEDSLIRAILSGSIFIWQPYAQEEGEHLKKLNAFLEKYFTDIPEKLKNIFFKWSRYNLELEDWIYLTNNFENLINIYIRAREYFLKKGSGIDDIYVKFIR